MFKKYRYLLDDAFWVTVLFKGIGGSIELIGAFVVLFMSAETFFNLIKPLHSIGLDTSEALASSAKSYVFWYLFSHGVVRAGLAYSLLKEYLWAYPVALVVLAAFTIYQVDLLINHFSIGLVGLIIFNLLVFALTWYEWRRLRAGGHLEHPHL